MVQDQSILSYVIKSQGLFGSTFSVWICGAMLFGFPIFSVMAGPTNSLGSAG